MKARRMNHISEPSKQAVDALSIVTVLGALAEWLPAIAALFSIIWTAIRIWETKTVTGWVEKLKATFRS